MDFTAVLRIFHGGIHGKKVLFFHCFNKLRSEEPPRRSQRKNGPPSSAVITPTGISAGAMMVLETASQSVRNMPPNRRDAGARYL